MLRKYQLAGLAVCLGCSSPGMREPVPGETGGAPGTGGGATGGSTGTGGAGPGTDAATPDAGNNVPADSAAPAGMGEDAGPPPATSAGCGMNKPGGVFEIAAGAAKTNYRLVLPKSYDGTRPYPVIFYLHGRGNGIEGQGNLNTDVAAADLGLVVYPKSYGGSGWEVPGRDKPEENLALLKALLAHLQADYCVNPRRVIMTGFSSGCWFASRLACTMKDQLAGVVAAACGLDPMGKCMDRKPMTYIIGRGDPRFGDAAMTAEFYRTRNGCTMTQAAGQVPSCQDYQGCAEGFPTAYCPHPGGHQWPGFASKAVVELLSRLP